jgi:hypothetical protein
MSIDNFGEIQDQSNPIIGLECTFGDFLANEESLREIIPKGSYVDHVADGDGETCHLIIVLPKEYGEIADQLMTCAALTLAGQKVPRTWLN